MPRSRSGPNALGSAAAAWPNPAAVIALLAVVVLGCAPREDAETPSDTADTVALPAAAPSRVASVEGFSTPESVRYDGDQDVFFVSNINGNPAVRDNNGFISRVRPDGTIDSFRFIAGGRVGVTLHAPKGMAITGDTLWVADIDALRGFNRRTGAAVGVIEFGNRARFLNDVAAAPDGSLYISDTGITFDAGGQMSHPGPNQVFRVTGRRIEAIAQGDDLAGPNGVTWDRTNSRLIIAPFAGDSIMAWTAGQQSASAIASGPGDHDGVELLADGRMLVSSWRDSTVHVLDRGATRFQPLITGVPAPADIGVDTQRNRVAIPLFMDNRVEIWEIR